MILKEEIYNINEVRALIVLAHQFPRPSILSLSDYELPYGYERRLLLDKLVYNENQRLIMSIMSSHKYIVQTESSSLWYSTRTGRILNHSEIIQRTIVERNLTRTISLQQNYKQILDYFK